MALDDAYFKLLDGLITSSEIEKLKRQYYQDGFNDGYKAGYEQRCKNDSDLTIEIKEDLEDGGYVAHCPTYKGCWSQGDTIVEALKNIVEAFVGYLKTVEDDEECK